VANPRSAHGAWALREIVRPAFLALRAEYGLSVEPLQFGELPAPRPDLITYVVYGPTDPLAMTADEKSYLASLARAGVRTNVISAYQLTAEGTDRPGYERARTAVPELCDELGVNALYPDELDLRRGIRTNTWQDVYVNVIGETIRVKYTPTQSNDPGDISVWRRLCAEHAGEVAELARLHRELRLWQRKPWTDGSIVFAHDGHWFVSQTVTDKTLMTPADFALITSYDEGRRALTYTGPRLPSSDAPEYLMLSTLLSMHGRRPRLVVHFHHRDLTRGDRFRELVTATTVECGQFAAGRRFFAELRARGSDWFIIREHGMVWIGDSTAEFEQFVRQVLA
jgi:ribulose-5-phosphate 4-epimerase/fuculose-1-phosphate aldolase